MTDSAPLPSPGWYPVDAGGQRFWNGKEWTADVLGAPSASAEYEALSPTLPLPPMVPAAAVPAQPAGVVAPGWYPNSQGMTQWWDGTGWGPLSPAAPVLVRPMKEVGLAYVLLIFLGGFGAHRFYLNRVGSAVTMLALFLVGWLTAIFVLGIFLLIALVIWEIVDLFLVPSMVREANQRRV